ncbi:MAG: substrate-binding domain-containing protein [Kiritimatiellae bacterium]|nr:substrate-binding domain-containing protein [Kiritimatiellia bacterium]
MLLHFGGASGRDLLSGMLDAIKPGMHWHTRLLDDVFPNDANHLMDGIDGVITSERGDAAFHDELKKRKVPTVVIGHSEADFAGIAAPLAFVHNYDIGIGQSACRYFQSLGDFRSFVFLPAAEGTRWSEQRETGFREALAASGRRCTSVKLSRLEECNEDNKSILDAIRSAKKPCAVFAAWDDRAAQALAVCAENGIDVPGQVAVLGTDDDELVCDHTTPPLSSIKPNHRKVGAIAVTELARLFKSKPSTRHVIHCPCKTIIERESTRPIPPMAQLVRRALKIIRERAAQGISPADVADLLGVSRRLLDIRLVQTEGATIHKLLSDARLDAVACELKKGRRLTIRAIAKKLGYGDIKRLERQFKSRFGKTMSAWRE